MRENTWRGVTDQNGHNKHFYRMYDHKGRVVGSPEGIVTTPAELSPRERFVERNLEGFQPRAVDPTVRPKAFLQAEDRDPGATLTVNVINNQRYPGKAESEKVVS